MLGKIRPLQIRPSAAVENPAWFLFFRGAAELWASTARSSQPSAESFPREHGTKHNAIARNTPRFFMGESFLPNGLSGLYSQYRGPGYSIILQRA